MAHPQGSPRGFISKKRFTLNNSTSTLSYNSTGIVALGALFVSNQATYGKLSANSTALLLPNSVRIGTKTTYLSSNTTGVKLGTKYISTNTTGN